MSIVTCDLAASAAFYHRLGLSISDPALDRSGAPFHASGMATGGVNIDLSSDSFAQVWKGGRVGRADLVGRVVLGFSLASRAAVDRTYAELTGAGYAGLQPSYDAFWGVRYAVVEDPSGVAVGLMSPIEVVRKASPPELWRHERCVPPRLTPDTGCAAAPPSRDPG